MPSQAPVQRLEWVRDLRRPVLVLRTAIIPPVWRRRPRPKNLARVYAYGHWQVIVSGLTSQGEPGTMPPLSNKRLAEPLQAIRIKETCETTAAAPAQAFAYCRRASRQRQLRQCRAASGT